MSVYSPWLSHLLFADDCIMFSQASEAGASRLQAILDLYHRGSGQLVNKQKSTVFFSANCEDETKKLVLETLGINSEAVGEKYLCLPTALGRSTTESFEYLPERARKHVTGWGGKKLSFLAREVLLKSVVQAVPTYAMTCFELNGATCKKITTCMSKYFWGGSLDKHKMHWLCWEAITRAKSAGGMGFKDLKMFNLAMLGNRAGACSRGLILFVPVSLKANTSPMEIFFRLPKRKISLTLGEPFWLVVRF